MKTEKIKKLLVDKDKGFVSWDSDSGHIEISCPTVDHAIVSDMRRMVFILSNKNNKPFLLQVFDFNGNEIYSSEAPKSFSFYYLSNHPDVDVSVVCVCDEPIDGWRDWHFGINLKEKKLYRHCPAY